MSHHKKEYAGAEAHARPSSLKARRRTGAPCGKGCEGGGDGGGGLGGWIPQHDALEDRVAR